MSLAISILFVVGLFAVLGLAAWAVVALEMSRAALSTPSGVAAPGIASSHESRELVGQHAG